mgnify:CR=1 FL=1
MVVDALYVLYNHFIPLYEGDLSGHYITSAFTREEYLHAEYLWFLYSHKPLPLNRPHSVGPFDDLDSLTNFAKGLTEQLGHDRCFLLSTYEFNLGIEKLKKSAEVIPFFHEKAVVLRLRGEEEHQKTKNPFNPAFWRSANFK